MAQQPVLARDTVTQILAGDGTTWLEIEGVNNVVPDLSANEVTQEKTVYANGGQYAAIKTQRGGTLELGYLRYRDDVSGARPPGQLRVETLGANIGAANYCQVRYREVQDTQWILRSEAMVVVGSTTGDTNALRSGTYTFTFNTLPQLVAV